MRVADLLAWYERVKRPLPWRATRDPYALLVSGVMLHQTQAARVVPYYEAFLRRFPDPPALATAPTADVLAHWSGLGYNRRALQLQNAARQIAATGWPRDLTELPGVGPYTAAAVASFAWDRQVAAADTNVRRVLERHDGAPRGPAATRRRAQELVPAGRAATFNQAMMELGATVCRPRTPDCAACPISTACASQGRTHAPRPAARAGSRFEDSDRYARGRILHALVHGTPPPRLESARRTRAEQGLIRDGLAVRTPEGLKLP